MQNFKPYLTLPVQSGVPPLATPASLPRFAPPVLAVGESSTISGNVGQCQLPTPGYLSVKPPISLVYRVHPNNYTQGFNSSGRVIGVNQEIPHPSEGLKYHSHPFSRDVDWYTIDQLAGDAYDDVLEKRFKEANDLEPETPEYFTVDNDEGYQKWVAKKAEEKKRQQEQQAQAKVVTPEIKSIPGHFGLTITETTNENYGQYLDLAPKYPAVYPVAAKISPVPLQVLVKFRQSNMSDHPLIPDHSFAVDPREMINKDGCYTRGIQGAVYYPIPPEPLKRTAYNFRQRPEFLGQVIGDRKQGCTWPMYSPTGLELNRPVSRCVSILAGVDGKSTLRTLLPARSVPYIYNRYTPRTILSSQSPQTEPNPAQRPQRQVCVPFTPHPPANPQCDPCSLKFFNPQILPVPVELRKPLPC